MEGKFWCGREILWGLGVEKIGFFVNFVEIMVKIIPSSSRKRGIASLVFLLVGRPHLMM